MKLALQTGVARLPATGNWAVGYLGGKTVRSGLSELAAEIQATALADSLGTGWDCYSNADNGVNEWLVFQAK